MFDFNDPAIQQHLPSYLSQTAYTQAGGTPGGYVPWATNQVMKGMQQASLVQYDPRFFQGQDNFDNATGMGPQIQRNDKGEPTNIPGAILPSQVQAQQDKINSTMGGGSSSNAATPGAANALASGARSLQNRRPGLAGGFKGWSGDMSGSGSSNYNYFSKFA